MNAGNVYLSGSSVKDTPWAEAFLEELRFAPFGSHDDQIDAAAGALSMLIKGRARVGGVKRKKEPQKKMSYLGKS